MRRRVCRATGDDNSISGSDSLAKDRSHRLNSSYGSMAQHYQTLSKAWPMLQITNWYCLVVGYQFDNVKSSGWDMRRVEKTLLSIALVELNVLGHPH